MLNYSTCRQKDINKSSFESERKRDLIAIMTQILSWRMTKFIVGGHNHFPLKALQATLLKFDKPF